MMVEEKGLPVLRPDAAVPEAIREPWRTHRRRGLFGYSVEEAGAQDTTAIVFAGLASVNFGFSPCFNNGEKLSCILLRSDLTVEQTVHEPLDEAPPLPYGFGLDAGES